MFAAQDTKTGNVIGRMHRRHRCEEFRKFLDSIEKSVSEELDIHLVMDNYAADKTDVIQRWLLKRPRFHVYLRPT